MKLIIAIITNAIFILNLTICEAQVKAGTSPTDPLTDIQTKTKNSEFVIEVHVLSVKGFRTPHSIHTSAIARVLKVFKGIPSDSIIEIIYPYGTVEGGGCFPSDGGWFALGPEEEGILFLSNNKSEITLHNELPSYVPDYGPYSIVGYTNQTKESLEKGIFKDIEKVTGQKRVVLGLNILEKPPKYSLEAKVAASEAIVEGIVVYRRGFKLHNTVNYGSVLVKVSKVFKGDIKDSIIELNYVDAGNDEALANTYGFATTDKEEGIFFLIKNKTGISLTKDTQSFVPDYGRNSIAYYKWADPFNKNYFATCHKDIYHDPEKDLFQKIESLTGLKRKVLRKNSFE